jgi:hypothetical protein
MLIFLGQNCIRMVNSFPSLQCLFLYNIVVRIIITVDSSMVIIDIITVIIIMKYCQILFISSL